MIDVFLGILGMISALIWILSGICIGIAFINGLIPSLFKGDWCQAKESLYALFIFGIIFTAISIPNAIAYNKTEDIKIEVKNIISYEGISEFKEGKSIYTGIYFKQGTNENYKIIKLKEQECIFHETNEEVRIIKNVKKHTAILKNLWFSCWDDKYYYDIYIPKNDK